jgi:hypothetical protein
MKKRLVAFKGGSCQKCGYDRCVAALDFHHRDPSQKLFKVSQKMGSSYVTLVAEIEKCDLLCRNCHAEVEVGFDGDRGRVV